MSCEKELAEALEELLDEARNLGAFVEGLPNPEDGLNEGIERRAVNALLDFHATP